MITPKTKFGITLAGLAALLMTVIGFTVQVYQAKLDIQKAKEDNQAIAKKLKEDMWWVRQWVYSATFPDDNYAKRWRAEHRWFRDDRDE